jgi:azurin
MSVRPRLVAVTLLTAIVAAAPLAAQSRAAQPPPRVVTITVSDPVADKMQYSLKQIVAKPGERLTVRLLSQAQTPKIVMAHNWVLLKSPANVKAFIDAAANARATDFIPPAMKTQILADIGLVGPGERLEVTFTAPKTPGTYPYVCSFAGHYAAGMFGDLIVK